jgi:hypothetical protein
MAPIASYAPRGGADITGAEKREEARDTALGYGGHESIIEATDPVW